MGESFQYYDGIPYFQPRHFKGIVKTIAILAKPVSNFTVQSAVVSAILIDQ
jgi:hypothetical protein